jgi:ATP diphosphatase
MEKLRDPNGGCPWDLKQTFASIVPYTIEEAYEVADAIEQGNIDHIQEELGDLLFQVVFYAQLGKEQQHFDFEGIAHTVAEKLIRRHPHVFDTPSDKTLEQLDSAWDAIKQQEQLSKNGTTQVSILDNIPIGMAPLIRAQKLQKRCAKVGFDWPQVEPVLDKVKEEIDEVEQELAKTTLDKDKIEEEIGDLLFAVVNLSRHLEIDAETAIRKANAKFARRFQQVESTIAQQGKSLDATSLEGMEIIWQQVKKQEHK